MLVSTSSTGRWDVSRRVIMSFYIVRRRQVSWFWFYFPAVSMDYDAVANNVIVGKSFLLWTWACLSVQVLGFRLQIAVGNFILHYFCFKFSLFSISDDVNIPRQVLFGLTHHNTLKNSVFSEFKFLQIRKNSKNWVCKIITHSSDYIQFFKQILIPRTRRASHEECLPTEMVSIIFINSEFFVISLICAVYWCN